MIIVPECFSGFESVKRLVNFFEESVSAIFV